LIANVLAEFALVADSNMETFNFYWWAFVILHLIRNLALIIAFMWNVLKSEIYNALLIKLIPWLLGIILFLVLNSYVYGVLKAGLWMLIFTVSNALLLIAAGLRMNHTSDNSLIYSIGANCLFILSDAFFGLTISGFWLGLRSVFLIFGGYWTCVSVYDHVANFKLTSKDHVYKTMEDKNMSPPPKMVETVI
jgi:hypothetical protein